MLFPSMAVGQGMASSPLCSTVPSQLMPCTANCAAWQRSNAACAAAPAVQAGRQSAGMW